MRFAKRDIPYCEHRSMHLNRHLLQITFAGGVFNMVETKYLKQQKSTINILQTELK